jgi:hypothetical protein
MKVRTGFVSNSSSSSFAIIGVDDEGITKEVIRSYGFNAGDEYSDEDWFCDAGWGGTAEHDGWLFAGYSDGPNKVGMKAEELLQIMTIPQACELVKAKLKERGVGNYAKVEFLYGEASSE